MKKLLYSFLLLASICLAQEDKINNVDCLILKDEDSIICKYSINRLEHDKEINMQWIDPNKKLSRNRTITIPQGHGSVYDFRYITGRQKGIWIFKVIDYKKEYTTSFKLE